MSLQFLNKQTAAYAISFTYKNIASNLSFYTSFLVYLHFSQLLLELLSLSIVYKVYLRQVIL